MTLPVPVLEIGGTHVTAALVDPVAWTVVAGSVTRRHLDAGAPADALLADLVAAAASLAAPEDVTWGVAVPDPFDYDRGIALFEGVGKFDSLNGVDVRAALLAGIPARPAGIAFLNDADAYALGEWTHGAGSGSTRCAVVTLGTGVGSGWIADGRIVDPGLPPGGRIHRLTVDGVPLEDVMSRRAVRRRYAGVTGDRVADVRDIADRARAGEPAARETLARALGALGRVVGPCVTRFHADVLVVGGSMSASWDLFAPWFTAGLADAAAGLPPVRVAAHPQDAPLLGAAAHTLGRQPSGR